MKVTKDKAYRIRQKGVTAKTKGVPDKRQGRNSQNKKAYRIRQKGVPDKTKGRTGQKTRRNGARKDKAYSRFQKRLHFITNGKVSSFLKKNWGKTNEKRF